MKRDERVQSALDGYGLVRAVHHRHTDAAAEVIAEMTAGELTRTLSTVIGLAVHLAEVMCEIGTPGKSVDGLLDCLMASIDEDMA